MFYFCSVVGNVSAGGIERVWPEHKNVPCYCLIAEMSILTLLTAFNDIHRSNLFVLLYIFS